MYSVNEGDGYVEVCVAITNPDDPSTLEASFQADIELSVDSGTAIGEY